MASLLPAMVRIIHFLQTLFAVVFVDLKVPFSLDAQDEESLTDSFAVLHRGLCRLETGIVALPENQLFDLVQP
jgi:hypothetical protein